MKLIVENFGPIQRGEIDLNKRFYVFVGYNNSGKSYLSQLLWSVLRFEFSSKMEIFEDLFEEKDLEKDTFDLIENQHLVQKILDKYAEMLKNEIVPRHFNLSPKDVLFENFQIKFQINESELKSLKLSNNLYLDSEEGIGTFLNTSKEKDSPLLQFSSNASDATAYKKKYTGYFILNLLFFHERKVTFLPANRAFFPSFYKYIFRLEREDKENIQSEMSKLLGAGYKNEDLTNALASVLESFKNPYTEATGNLFDNLYNLNFSEKENTFHQDFITALKDILGGDIVIKKMEGLGMTEFFLKLHSKEIELPMYLASSSVNQLTCLYLFFKYWAAENNNFLLIDEPEENLHPANQIKLTNLLLKFSSQNRNRVLITTHSPLITDVINNYLYLFFLRSKGIEIGEDLDSFSELNQEIEMHIADLGVYFFTGNEIKEYKMGEYGIQFDDFSREIKKVKNISSILTDKIYDFINQEV